MSFTQIVLLFRHALSEYKWALFGLVFTLLVLATLATHLCFGVRFDFDGFVTEFHGFLLDILLFGVLLYAYEQWQEKRQRVRDLIGQLSDFMGWKSEEGRLKKLIIIKQLNRLSVRLPSLMGIFLNGSFLEDLDLRQADLQYAQMDDAKLIRCDLSQSVMSNAFLRGISIQHSNMSGATLYGAMLEKDPSLKESLIYRVNLSHVNFTAANLTGANFNSCDLRDADFTRARMQGIWINGCDMTAVRLDGAHLEGADLRKAQNLTHAQLQKAVTDEMTQLPDSLAN